MVSTGFYRFGDFSWLSVISFRVKLILLPLDLLLNLERFVVNCVKYTYFANLFELRYLGVIGAEISILKIEEIFRKSVPSGAHGYLINLADATAIVHPHILQSYEVWISYSVSLFILRSEKVIKLMIYIASSQGCSLGLERLGLETCFRTSRLLTRPDVLVSSRSCRTDVVSRPS